VTDYSLSPAIDIRKYLWFELQDSGVLDASDYVVNGTNLVPIIPVEQQPEFVDKVKGHPFIVYDIVDSPTDSDMFYVFAEQVLLTVYCSDFGTSNKIRNLMIDLFRRQDLSARDLNNFATSGLQYLNVTILENSRRKPERSDSGRMSFDMLIETKYVRAMIESGRFS
jgi:hypothetical protein